MPTVDVNTDYGLVTFNYVLSTPTSTSADKIDPSLPTVLFLHPVLLASILFHPQFADPNLRRFNLLALDLRCQGRTTGTVPLNYGREVAAEDVMKFIEALNLPACHFFALSMGASVGMQFAISHGEKILSLFSISPLPGVEPPEVNEGRQEIHDCWVEANKDPDNVDPSAVEDAKCGALQLGFNGEETSMISAMIEHTIPIMAKRWGPDRFEEFHSLNVKFFTKSKEYPASALAKICCPIRLVHCSNDIAYPLDLSEDLFNRLKAAGVDVKLLQVPDATHFGCFTHPKEMDSMFVEFIREYSIIPLPPIPTAVTSPFEAELIAAGWSPGDEDEDEDPWTI